jgi:hypothetical protein
LGEILVCAFDIAYFGGTRWWLQLWFLVTLGDCRHLDGWWFVHWWGDLVIVSAPN